jgi:hypothetical protein
MGEVSVLWGRIHAEALKAPALADGAGAVAPRRATGASRDSLRSAPVRPRRGTACRTSLRPGATRAAR